MRTMSDDEIDRLGHAIAAEGRQRHEAEIGRIARLAAAAGASEAVLAVLTDRGGSRRRAGPGAVPCGRGHPALSDQPRGRRWSPDQS